MDRKRLLSPMKQQSFVLLHCRVGHTVRLERADAVQTGAALAARLVAALVAAPRQLIGNLQPQAFALFQRTNGASMRTSPPEPSTMEWFIAFTNSSLQSG